MKKIKKNKLKEEDIPKIIYTNMLFGAKIGTLEKVLGKNSTEVWYDSINIYFYNDLLKECSMQYTLFSDIDSEKYNIFDKYLTK